jgi:hypothetical protein
MKQRIALVAVSALTAGLFSVVSTPAANAAVVAVETLGIARTNSTTGAAVPAAAGVDIELMKSLGIVSIADGTGTKANADAQLLLTTGQSSTGNILASATIAVVIDSASKSGVTVSGGKIVGTTTSATAATVDSGLGSVVMADTSSMGVTIQPTGAVGSTMTIQGWTGAGVAAATPSNGVLAGTITFTVVAASASGVFSAGDSTVTTQVQRAKGTVCSGTATFDDVASIANNATACIFVNPKDAYGTAITTGNITASATNGAKVIVGAANAAAGFLAAAPFSSVASAANLYVTVVQATPGVGQTTAVSLTWNGVAIGTKNITFQGDIAKLTFVAASSKTNYKNGSTNAAADGGRLAVAYVATDALGQAVTLTAGPTISDATGAMTPAVLDNTNDGAIGLLQTAALGGGASAMTIASNALVGAGTFRLKLTNAAGVDIKSDVINATVSTGAATFTASWDKASYSPGEIAVLTITAKDSGGRGVAQGVAFGTNAAITINTDGFTSLTSGCDTLSTQTVKDADGSRKCSYAVKNTAGSYAYSVSVPTSSAQSAIAGTLKINADATAVSNADVLKSIVALIASINKQIQALQKLILKR